MKTLFLDESGDHDLINIDRKYPAFVLAGCILDIKDHELLTEDLNKFKERLFGTKNLILHYADYTRNKNGFEKVKERDFRNDFFEGINNLIVNHDYILLACIVDKHKHNEKYGYNAMNPYLLSLNLIVERFIFYLKKVNEVGKIIAESRNTQLDNELDLAYLNLKISGTRYLTPKEITTNIQQFAIKKKEENVAGLQLVDSLVTPIGRKYLNLKNFYLEYDNIKRKFRKKRCGKYKGYGLMILP
jgi:hypothetical protein